MPTRRPSPWLLLVALPLVQATSARAEPPPAPPATHAAASPPQPAPAPPPGLAREERPANASSASPSAHALATDAPAAHVPPAHVPAKPTPEQLEAQRAVRAAAWVSREIAARLRLSRSVARHASAPLLDRQLSRAHALERQARAQQGQIDEAVAANAAALRSHMVPLRRMPAQARRLLDEAEQALNPAEGRLGVGDQSRVSVRVDARLPSAEGGRP
jgi:hypothetical protein